MAFPPPGLLQTWEGFLFYDTLLRKEDIYIEIIEIFKKQVVDSFCIEIKICHICSVLFY